MQNRSEEARKGQKAKVSPQIPEPTRAADTNNPSSGSTARSRASARTQTTSASAQEPTPTKPDYHALFKQLVARANAGERNAILLLRRFLDQNPQIWQEAGNLTAVAERGWIELIAGQDEFRTDSVKRRLEDLKAELKGQHPTPLESLLIDQIAVTWLGNQHSEIQAASDVGGSLDQATFKLKRAESAQRRHLAAIKMLGTLRTHMPQALTPTNAGIRLFEPKQERA